VTARVAVIGAGAGGLAMARRLREAGVDFVVYEAGSHVGGLWVYQNDNGFAQAYRSLHINSESETTAFDGFPFPAGTALYPDHATMARYFSAFAEHFGIGDSIRLRTPVSNIRRNGSGWTVTAAGLDEEFSDVVVACGHQNSPRHPDFSTTFSGEYLHSHGYRTPDDFAGKRVLVVGAGNSALDIAADICTVTEQTYLASRSPVQILPRMVFGWPTSRVLARVEKPWVPWFVNRRVRELIGWVTHGSMKRWGLEAPKTRTHPTSHPTVVHHMEWQRIMAKPGIASIAGNTVTFTNGEHVEVDTIIAGTGYEIALPFLPEALGVTHGRELDLYRRIVVPGEAHLWFLGFFNVSGGANIPVLDVQAQWITAAILGRVTPPSAEVMRAEIQADQRNIAHRYPNSPRYGLELEPRRYLRRMRRETGAVHG
jgi:dimethylaniline monooxygenase (N-oxide forming)